jgi:tRNA (adenine57-N1/adenine58-N1)-methyltransferase
MNRQNPRGALQAGDDIILIDPKGEEHLLTLTPGKPFGTHKGNILHDDIIGKPDGSRVLTSRGTEYRVFRPTFNQYILNLKRHAQIIYPKDIGPILLWADIFPGATVVEAGIGWGALSIKLLEAVGPSGRLISYEVREDFAESGKKTVSRFLGECPNFEVKVSDIYLGIEEKDVDRIVLDLPEPWRVVPHAHEALAPGGILLSYLPSTLQVKQMADAVAGQGTFTEPEVFEVILRPWHVKGQSVRPVQWMFSHSAFIVVSRKIT